MHWRNATRCSHPAPAHLYTLLDPEVVSHRLPVLRAGDIQQALVDPALHGVVKDLKELGPDEWLSTTESREEGRLKLGRQLTAREILVPAQKQQWRKQELSTLIYVLLLFLHWFLVKHKKGYCVTLW